LSQIASQKELIRTAIRSVKELLAQSKIKSDQQIERGECPDDQIEAHHIRKVL